jgi:hypothetical protein
LDQPMDIATEKKTPQGKPIIKIIAISILVVISIAGILLYNNFNNLLSAALLRSFDSSIASDVYELKFENLRVDLFDRTIRVYNVTILPREKPLNNYPYINSSFRLKTEKLILKNVELFTLLESSQLRLKRISITKPNVELLLTGKKSILLPFKDSTATNAQDAPKKKFIDSFFLSEFQLVDASFHVTNENKQREFQISEFNISLYNLFINQKTGRDLISLSEVNLAVGEFNGNLTKGPMKSVNFKNFNIGIDSLKLQMTRDTSIFHFDNLKTGLKDLDIQTADSLFHLTLQSFELSYKEKSIKLSEVSFKPNFSDSTMQKRFVHQHTQVSGTVDSINFININFDSLIYYKGLSIGEIIINRPNVSIFKDNTKPVDTHHLPIYFGQQVKGIPIPLWIGQVQANHVHLTNIERKRDSSYAKVTIHRGIAVAKNITNRATKKSLGLSASAYIENKVHFNLTLDFSYSKPEFRMNGKLKTFKLSDLNSLIQAYTPAKINDGIVDEITFSGRIFKTYSSGTMKFLFHDLRVDLDLPKKAKWKSSVVAFAANTVLNSSNPGSADLPPRVVQFRAERNMNKGFINIIIKSVLSGLKETILMSKENKKAYREAKKQMKKQNK